MARITKNKLREMNIYNPHNLATNGHSKLFISYIPGDSGRMGNEPYWEVSGIGFEADPKAWWGHYGSKVFSVTCRINKIPMLNEAICWCYDKYDIPKDQWEKDPFGGWQIKGTIQKAINGFGAK